MSAKDKWSAERLLQESRRRTARLVAEGKPSAEVQRMLSDLLVEARWRESAFIRALLQDVIAHPPTRSGTVARPGLARSAAPPRLVKAAGAGK